MFRVLKLCTILVAVSVVGGVGDNAAIANKYFLEKQKFLFDLLHRVDDPPLKQELSLSGAELVLDQAEYLDYNEQMVDFYRQYTSGQLLPRGQHFSPLLACHARQAYGLYHFLYNAGDWSTFRTNACWARVHANEGVFVHALTQALIKREDFRNLIVPHVYELLPHLFFPRNFVHAAESFDFAVWSRARDLGEAFNGTQNAHGMPVMCTRCWPWQWWRFVGLQKKVYRNARKQMLPGPLQGLRSSVQWRRAMEDVKLLWTPVDYSRDLEPTNVDNQLSYLTEDVGWNSFWYYLNQGVSWVSDSTITPILREWWLWNLRQLLARYYLEGRSQQPRRTKVRSHNPHLISWTGERFHGVEEIENLLLGSLDKLEDRVNEALIGDGMKLRNRELVPLNSAENLNAVVEELFADLRTDVAQHLERTDSPTLLHNFETMLREPAFYRCAQKLLEIYWTLRSTRLPYDSQILTFPGVHIVQVRVSPLVSDFELVDLDVSNLLNNKMFYYKGQLMPQKALFARQQRLSHKPFRLLFNITAEQPQDMVIRTFLGPRNSPIGGIDWRHFYQLDTFVTNIPAGNNLVQRRSVDFTGTIKDHPSQTEMYQLVELALEGRFDLPLNISTSHYGFPNRLLLPRGSALGLPLQMFFIATPYENTPHNAPNLQCDFSKDVDSFDELPCGFPFDRPVTLEDVLVPNAYMMPVKIYHQERRGKRFATEDVSEKKRCPLYSKK